ncbi:MAG: hypothetical protein JWN98_1874 [Abditibacteriota bacterium]|nr:hypothetical protein [Abditibacteriota bacterium]
MQSLLPQTKVLPSRRRALPLRTRASQRATQRSGFTLIELMVVLAISVVVTSITVNGFRELSDSNKRTACQTNLRQVYQGLRLYMNDTAGGVPLYYHVNQAGTTERNIGLWALYTYPKDGTTDELADVGSPSGTALSSKPVARYIRNAKVLHCPSGFIDGETLTVNGVEADRESLYLDTEHTRLNPHYLSYQVSDNGANGLGTPGDVNTETYRPSRMLKPNPATPAELSLWKRQLNLLVPDANPGDGEIQPDRIAGALPQDDTIVTWCRWHQGIRGFDNVLFFDGSVQYIQHEQINPDPAGTPATLTNWQRVPKPIVP